MGEGWAHRWCSILLSLTMVYIMQSRHAKMPEARATRCFSDRPSGARLTSSLAVMQDSITRAAVSCACVCAPHSVEREEVVFGVQ